MNILVESITRIKAGPYRVRVWRQEENESEPDNIDLTETVNNNPLSFTIG